MDQVEYLGYTGSVLSYNLYTYCEGNPVIYVDYSGEWMDIIIVGVVLFLSIIIIVITELVSINSENKKEAGDYFNQNAGSLPPSVSTISKGGSFGKYLAEDDPVGNILKINSIRW